MTASALTINGTSTAQQVQAFLTHIQAQKEDVQEISKEVCSENTASRLGTFKPGPGGTSNYQACSMIANNGMMQRGELVMLASPPNIVWEQSEACRNLPADTSEKERARLQQKRIDGLTDWHCSRAAWVDCALYTFDSTYSHYGGDSGPSELAPGRLPQLGYFVNLGQTRNLVQEMGRGKKAIDRILIGSGGNVDGMNTCRVMTRAWLARAGQAAIPLRSNHQKQRRTACKSEGAHQTPQDLVSLTSSIDRQEEKEKATEK